MVSTPSRPSAPSVAFSRTLDDVRDMVASDDAGKHDYLVPVKEIALQHGRLFLPGADDDGMGFALTAWATAQACGKLGIPVGYFNRCPTELQDAQFNHWRQQEETLRKIAASAEAKDAAKWTVRVKNAMVRGVLSARYDKLDNRQLLDALLPVVSRSGGRFQVSLVEMTQESFHLRLVDPRISRDVLPGDRLLVGIHLANSEVGFRAVTVDAVVWRLVCQNGLVRRVAGKSLLRQRHIHVADARFIPLLEEAIAQATILAAGFIEQMALAVKTPVPDPEKAIAYLGQMWGLTKQTQEYILLALLGEPKTGMQDTLYGLVNAVTNAAQRLSIDDRFQLETLASVLIDTSATSKNDYDLRQRILSGAK
jgi:hypothetical protein